MKALRTLAALGTLFAAVSGNVLAASYEKYEIRAAAATPEEARLTEGARSVDVLVQVRVKVVGTFTGNVPACESAVDFGDGGAAQRVTLGKKGGTSNITDIPHAYSKPGHYTVTISGTRGTNACDGRTTTEVIVLAPGEAGSAAATTTPGAAAAGGKTATATSTRKPAKATDSRLSSTDLEVFDDMTLESGRNPCPPGWAMVPKSNSAQYRFACQAQPVKPLDCQGGTSFYQSGNVIGCR